MKKFLKEQMKKINARYILELVSSKEFEKILQIYGLFFWIFIFLYCRDAFASFISIICIILFLLLIFEDKRG